MKDKKKLMILGAGPNQVPAIKKAVELGFYTITVDSSPDNLGHKLSHESMICSTIDKQGVLKLAMKNEIAGIMTLASDIATPTVGYVAEHLGLNGCSEDIALTMSIKSNFRHFQSQHKLNHPKYFSCYSLEEFKEKLPSLELPLMFKPVDTSGSRGISKVTYSDEQCCKSFNYAKQYSYSGIVCIEKFVEGVDISGDAFLIDGKVKICVPTQKHKRDFVISGHSLPTKISINEQRKVIEELESTCHQLGYLNGPLNFDIIVSSKKITIIELSPRLGGNGIPKLIQKGTGIDIIEVQIMYVMGQKFDLFELELPIPENQIKECGYYVFGARYSGKLVNIADHIAMTKALPHIFEYSVNYQLGDTVPAFEHNGNSLGSVLFEINFDNDYKNTVKKIDEVINLKLRPASK